MKKICTAFLVAAASMANAADHDVSVDGSAVNPGTEEAPVKITAGEKPNIVLLFADDLGWSDLSYEERSDLYETPHIDRFAEQALEFTSAYVSHPTCAPSRLGIMTGKVPARAGVINNNVGEAVGTVDTLAERLQASGYTTGIIGKWHLGNDQLRPEHQGFDRSIASNLAGQPARYLYPFKKPKRTTPFDVPDLEKYEKGDELTECMTDEALHFMRKNKGNRFFLYMSYYAVHVPLQAKQEKIEKFKAKLKTNPDSLHRNATYAAMIEHLDESVGRILKALEKEGLAENTIVIFFSDNGGYGRVTSNVPLRDYKGTLYEGGIRVPMFIRWPGVTIANTKCDVPVIGHDLYPTLLALAGGEPAREYQPDGVNLLPLLRKPSGTLKRKTLYWTCYPLAVHHNRTPDSRPPQGAIRKGDWKLVESFPTLKGRKTYALELFNLAEDIGESKDLLIQNPDKANELLEEMYALRMKHSTPVYDVNMYGKPNPAMLETGVPGVHGNIKPTHQAWLSFAQSWLSQTASGQGNRNGSD